MGNISGKQVKESISLHSTNHMRAHKGKRRQRKKKKTIELNRRDRKRDKRRQTKRREQFIFLKREIKEAKGDRARRK